MQNLRQRADLVQPCFLALLAPCMRYRRCACLTRHDNVYHGSAVHPARDFGQKSRTVLI